MKRCVKSGRKPERGRWRTIKLLSFLSILKIDTDLHIKHTALPAAEVSRSNVEMNMLEKERGRQFL